MGNSPQPKPEYPFTSFELLLVIAIFAWMPLPALAKEHGIACMNKSKQLMLVWCMYAEHNDDGYSAVNMTGHPKSPKAMKWVDYHSLCCCAAAGIAFADGHSEIHKWLDSRTTLPATKGRELKLNVSTPDSLDMLWMQEQSSDPVNR